MLFTELWIGSPNKDVNTLQGVSKRPGHVLSLFSQIISLLNCKRGKDD